MCGIFLYLSYKKPIPNEYTDACIHRGPDQTDTQTYFDGKLSLTFHRLAINGLSEKGMQPFKLNNYILMCNGEIYNYKELAEEHNIELTSGSDCEVIIPLVEKYGVEETVSMLDGVFGITLWNTTTNILWVARDPIGVRPIFWGTNESGDYIIASEAKCFPHNFNCQQLLSGSIMRISFDDMYIQPYWSLPRTKCPLMTNNMNISSDINSILTEAVKKRLISDRPIGCFLSGGLDSSIIASILTRLLRVENKKLKTFSVGLEGSPDIEAARIVSKYLDTDHHELIVTEDDLFNNIEPTIKQIESYDITTVRASTPMYLLSKWISKNTDVIVLFSGEGSDELFGSYLYFKNAPDLNSFQQETHRLIEDLPYFDVLRSDRSTAGAGLEIRVPFLDKKFVSYITSLPPNYKIINDNTQIEKAILRDAFKDYLPDSIINRRKEAFSDGVSKEERSWYKIIQERVSEEQYYKDIFNKYYPGRDNLIPYLWLPKWSGDTNNEPSARVLT